MVLRYYHYRLYQDDKMLANGGVTVCYDEDARRLGVAVCSWKDNYNKRVGRNIAKGRLAKGSGKYTQILEPDDCKNTQMVMTAIQVNAWLYLRAVCGKYFDEKNLNLKLKTPAPARRFQKHMLSCRQCQRRPFCEEGARLAHLAVDDSEPNADLKHKLIDGD